MLLNRYRGAIRDASSAEPFEIYRKLQAVVPYEPGLVWRGRPGESEVLVLNWTGRHDFDGLVGQATEATEGRWVTLAPKVRDLCRKLVRRHRGPALDLRLKQLLGLPPDAVKDRLVEFWVWPQDLLRPCPDPEVTDHECGLVPPSPGVVVDEGYRRWFEDTMKTSYTDDGYPWTRLGYTYDWGNPRTEVGLSEFIIRTGAKVEVHSITVTTGEYCGR
ncbi:MAG: hypothetical protein KDD11_22950 [Acidobacteria bacterium]|nr:hypothetical protein [Acidobacteriota bacterium]